MIKKSLLLIGIVLASFGAPKSLAFQPLKVYYVRHAESGHNALKKWKFVPASLRPAYVGNEDAFSPEGEKQVATLTDQLSTLKFDFIAVSPTWRTRNTILPYLKESGLTGEIWPELTETPSVHTEWLRANAKLPPPSPKLLEGGATIHLPDGEQSFFTFREEGLHLLRVLNNNEEERIAYSVALAERTIDLIRTRFSRSGKSILLVGHGNSGSTLLRELVTDKITKPSLDNIGMWMAEEQPDGTFRLELLNSRPYVN